MHKSAMLRMKWFVDNYIPTDRQIKILDVGSYDVNGSYRELFRDRIKVKYIGMDVEKGPNVDYVPRDSYHWDELEDESFDYIISGNAFEHIEYPWLTMEQIYKKLKKDGYACILAPHTIGEHKHPVDCYRYFADGFKALAKWAHFNIVDVTVGGIPKKELTKEWKNDNADDTMMIVTKISDEDILNTLPKMACEILLGWDSGWRRRYDFLKMWLSEEIKKEDILSFMYMSGYDRAYIYGWGIIGKTVYKAMKDVGIKVAGIVDANAAEINDIEVIKAGAKIDIKDTDCMLITVMDDGMKNILAEKYTNLPMFYLNEIF